MLGNIDIMQYLYKGIWAVGTALGSWFVLFPLRTAISRVKEKAKILDEVRDELATQRTNCLTTLQTQGDRQIELLERVNDTLNDINLGQAEMSGYMRGQGTELKVSLKRHKEKEKEKE